MIALESMWDPSPLTASLHHDDVHTWQVSLDQPDAVVERLTGLLSEDEQGRAHRFHFARDRRRFVVGRGQLRTLLGHYAGIEPCRVQFRYTAHGKPALAQNPATPYSHTLRFNVSHSNELALVVITQGRDVGIDLEHIRKISDVEQLAGRFFSTREHSMLRALPADQRLHGFFNCWTRKEAYVKAVGDGLRLPLDRFDVSLAPGEPVRLLGVDNNPDEASRWSLRELTPAPGYVAALAVEGHHWRLSCRKYAV
jgi:4'-phosphopantetheinyl transferase